MSPSTKKILLILALLGTSVLIGIGLYFMFRSAAAPRRLPPVTPGETIPGQLPAAGERPSTTTPGEGMPAEGGLPEAGRIQGRVPPSYTKPAPVNQLTDNYVTFPSLSKGGNLRYHNASDGKFYRILPNGETRELSDQVFYNVNKVTWARNKDQAVLEYPDGSKIVYNFETRTQVSLPRHWREFSFSNEGNQIAAKSMALAPENRWLVVTNDNGTGTQLIEHLGDYADEVQVNWSPSRQTVAFSQTGEPLGAYRREILLLGTQGENFKSLTVEGTGFVPQWSPTGKRLLYSVYSSRSNFKPELWIVNAYGDSIGSGRQLLNLSTWADKCSFGSDTLLFCAVPRALEQGAGMAREIANDTPDDLYKIDLRTGLRSPISLGGEFTIKDISYDSTRNRVIFTDMARQGVFEAPL